MNVKRPSWAAWSVVAALVATLLPLALPAVPAMAAASWSQVGADIDGEAAGDNSGRSVAWSADGGTVAVGAINNDAGSGVISDEYGHVRVYDLISTTFVQRGADIDGAARGDQLGWSVALSADGDTVVIGAPQIGPHLKGYVRVYDWDSGSAAWVKRGADILGTANDDQFGRSVAVSADGDTVAIGAPQEIAGSPTGYVRVYGWNGAAWVQRGLDIVGEDTYSASGYAVDLSADGSTVAIGAMLNGAGYNEYGQVRVYRWSGTAWVQRGTDIDGVTAVENSGFSVALSDDGATVAIGAPFNSGVGTSSSAGLVRVFDWSGTAWVQRGSDIIGEAAGDSSGRSVALSADGNTVAIGAHTNDGGGAAAGHVRVYDWDGTATPAAWVQRGNDIDGEAAGDLSGTAVALSADGDTVIIGAPTNDGTTGNASDSRGHVRVYRWQTAAAPTVSGITPPSGTTAGGTSVKITGTGFSAGATVTIGGQACTSVVVVSDTEITCVTPSGTAGTANVVVTNGDSQTGTLSNGYTYVTPPSGPGIFLDSCTGTLGSSTVVSWDGYLAGSVQVEYRKVKSVNSKGKVYYDSVWSSYVTVRPRALTGSVTVTTPSKALSGPWFIHEVHVYKGFAGSGSHWEKHFDCGQTPI